MKRNIRNLLVLLKATYSDFLYNKKHILNRDNGGLYVDFANLRMYCHMLDKAMNNPNFETGHSLKIYRAAKRIQQKISSTFAKDKAFCWTNEIISRFENAQKTGKPILKIVSQQKYSEEEITFISQFITSRISCRNFIDKKIESNIIRDIVSLAIDAPNGCCRQTVRFRITQNKNIIQNVTPSIAGITNFTNIQCLVAVCAESSFYNLVDKNLQYVDASLAAENFILAARLYGIYGTMCNFFHASIIEQKMVKENLDIAKTENIVMFIALGYPKTLPEKPIRCNVESFYKEI